MKKKVCIIHTGGTIGMVSTEHGYAPKPGFMKQALRRIHELAYPDMPAYDLVEYKPLLDSSDMAVKDWVRLANDIAKKYDQYHGFVVLHGTDTMAYTASALSFMLEGLEKPVILTGSQIPLGELRNDARDNLITAMMLAGQEKGIGATVPEVSLYFRNRLYRGNRVTKVSADDFIGFDSPNYPPLVDAETTLTINEPFIRAVTPGGLVLRPFWEQKIAVLKIFPGIKFDLFENLLTPDLKGIVIEAFGSGNIPNRHGDLLSLLQKAQQNGTVMVVCTQCLRGSVNLGNYESSRDLVDAGAVSGYDMTVEAAVTKLYHLFSMGYDSKQVKEWMKKDLRGELTPPV